MPQTRRAQSRPASACARRETQALGQSSSGFAVKVTSRVENGLTNKTQRRRPQDAPIATATARALRCSKWLDLLIITVGGPSNNTRQFPRPGYPAANKIKRKTNTKTGCCFARNVTFSRKWLPCANLPSRDRLTPRRTTTKKPLQPPEETVPPATMHRPGGRLQSTRRR